MSECHTTLTYNLVSAMVIFFWVNKAFVIIITCSSFFLQQTINLLLLIPAFWILTLIVCIIGEYLSPFSRLSFHFVDGFWLCKNFLIWCGPICLFFLLSPLPGEIYPMKHCCEQYTTFSCLCFLLGFLLFRSNL